VKLKSTNETCVEGDRQAVQLGREGMWRRTQRNKMMCNVGGRMETIQF
jgi:hypothetical protein